MAMGYQLKQSDMCRISFKYDRDEEAMLVLLSHKTVLAKIPGDRRTLMQKVASNMSRTNLVSWINNNSVLRIKLFTDIVA